MRGWQQGNWHTAGMTPQCEGKNYIDCECRVCVAKRNRKIKPTKRKPKLKPETDDWLLTESEINSIK